MKIFVFVWIALIIGLLVAIIVLGPPDGETKRMLDAEALKKEEAKGRQDYIRSQIVFAIMIQRYW